MKDETVHAKIPGEVFKSLKKAAESDHRTLHSLIRHILIQFSQGKLAEVKE